MQYKLNYHTLFILFYKINILQNIVGFIIVENYNKNKIYFKHLSELVLSVFN